MSRFINDIPQLFSIKTCLNTMLGRSKISDSAETGLMLAYA